MLNTGHEFKTVRAAKEYLAGRIAAEAKTKGSPLTEIECKMLFFSETGWTLPDMDRISAEFDQTYDQQEYERKVGALVRDLLARDGAEIEQEAWDDAVIKLCEGDHYLLVLIDSARETTGRSSSRLGAKMKPWLPTWDREASKAPNDLLRLIVVALVLFMAIALVAILFASLR